MKTLYFEITVNESDLFCYRKVVYDTQDIIKVSCDLVNGYGVNPENIVIKTFVDGQEVKGVTV